MKDCIKCKDCKYLQRWQTTEQAEQYDCSLKVLLCPSPDDYCSKAEKKEEQNQSDDAVNRQAVLDAIRRIGMCKCSTNEIEAVDECRRAVEALPPVTPKSETVTEFADRCRECGKIRKGHWIYDKTIENWRCSKCNETPKTMGYVGTADFMAEHFKFCNHCGAKMQVESDIKQGLNYADEDTLMSAT